MTQRYRRPPLAEVVCQFNFVPSQQWDTTVPGLLYERLRQELPRKRLVRRFETRDQREQDEVHRQFRVFPMLQLLREDERAFAQVGPDLLAVNHLSPYPGWEEFEPFICRCLNAYIEVAAPQGIARIGLRYINRMELPSPKVELGDYLLFRPELAPGLPTDFGAFHTAVVFAYEGGRDLLRLAVESVDTGTPEALGVGLDLDYFLQQPQAVSIADVSGWVASAHSAIEAVFEACITDALRDLFDPAGG